MRVGFAWLLIVVLAAPASAKSPAARTPSKTTSPKPAPAKTVSVRKVEALEGVDTVVRIELSGPLPGTPLTRMMPKADGQPDRLSVDLPGADLHGKKSRSADVGWGGIQRIRLGEPDERTARVVLDLDAPVDFDLAADGAVIMITLRGAKPEE